MELIILTSALIVFTFVCLLAVSAIKPKTQKRLVIVAFILYLYIIVHSVLIIAGL